jgi:transcriptional regulator with XRE-family HTH domain
MAGKRGRAWMQGVRPPVQGTSRAIRRLWCRRLDLGLPAEQLALDIGMAHNNMYRWEQNGGKPRMDLLEQWAAKLGLEIALVPLGRADAVEQAEGVVGKVNWFGETMAQVQARPRDERRALSAHIAKLQQEAREKLAAQLSGVVPRDKPVDPGPPPAPQPVPQVVPIPSAPVKDVPRPYGARPPAVPRENLRCIGAEHLPARHYRSNFEL